VNPFQKIKDEVVISMLKQVAKKRRLSPENMIEVLVQEAYQNLR
jgi:cysteine synthase